MMQTHLLNELQIEYWSKNASIESRHFKLILSRFIYIYICDNLLYFTANQYWSHWQIYSTIVKIVSKSAKNVLNLSTFKQFIKDKMICFPGQDLLRFDKTSQIPRQ